VTCSDATPGPWSRVPGQAAAALNAELAANNPSCMFITLLLAELEPASGRLTYLNAGHNPALLLRHGADPTITSRDGKSPLDLVRNRRDKTYFNLLSTSRGRPPR